MKKIFAVVLAAALCFTVCGCTNVFKEFKDSAETALETASPSPAITAAPSFEVSAAPTPVPTAALPSAPSATGVPETEGITTAAQAAAQSTSGVNDSVQSPQTTASAAQTGAGSAAPAIDAAAYAYNPVKVTKSPTSEVVYEGGSASFVAYAQNASGITWLLVAPDGGQIFDAAALAKSMPGLSISGIGTPTLTIGCIPLSLDGWGIQAKFYGEGGPVHSSMAYLSVWRYPASGTWNPWEQDNTGWSPWNQGSWNPWG